MLRSRNLGRFCAIVTALSFLLTGAFVCASQSGLIESRRCGKEVYYKAADTAQCRTLHETIERIMEISCPK